MSDPLSECIRDGTFPESDDLLTKDVSFESVSSLLASISQAKNELSNEIRDVGGTIAGNVDEWIVQAKKVQEDIAKCKVDARQIVEEHQRGEAFRNAVKDANNKVRLLETEIAFTKALEHEIQNISEITQFMHEIEHDLSADDPIAAVGKLVSIDASITNISAVQTKSSLLQFQSELRLKARRLLENAIESRWTIQKHENTISLLTETDKSASQSNFSSLTPDRALSALQDLQALPAAAALILRVVETFVLSILSVKSSPYVSSVERIQRGLVVSRGGAEKDVCKTLTILQEVLHFLHQHVPIQLQQTIASELSPKIVSALVSMWLDPALPHDLQELQSVEPLQKEVSTTATILEQYSWPGGDALREWIDSIPRNWLAKRRVTSLDAVRKAFSNAKGQLRPVEREERQTITLDDKTHSLKGEGDDWNADWDDNQGQQLSAKKGADDEEVSGWDFDTEEEQEDANGKEHLPPPGNDDDDAGEAWGWGDDDDAKRSTKETTHQSTQSVQTKSHQTNGGPSSSLKVQEMVLTETYYITDIPDYILEIIGKDIGDAHELQATAHKYFNSSAPAAGLASFPTLTLALFRATAPTYYILPSARYVLSNINLYNDTLYIAQKLKEIPDSMTLQPAIQSLSKFARQVYSAELDVQRTILADLLDGAQGFERCTTFPNSQACTNAVASTIDRLRHLHQEWSSILGESHLLQSLGLLLTTVFGKIIKDIEDMDDISEADSKQLVTFCQQILTLEDLFNSTKLPDLTGSAQQKEVPQTSQILLYVPNYLRFQYLQQILESSLVDIKYLWTEGELGLEFSVDEVVDLIKALFAESHYRRDAIRAIKGSSGNVG